MDARPVLISKRQSNTMTSCLKTSRKVRASTWIVQLRGPSIFRLRNDTGHDGHLAMAPATGSSQA
jgi:hypothetical protein